MELYPDSVDTRSWKDHVELHRGSTISNEWMVMGDIDQVVAGGQHVGPCAEIGFQSVGWLQVEKQQRLHSSKRLRWLHGQRNLHVAGLLGRHLWFEFGARRNGSAGNHDGLDDQLRRPPLRIEVAQNAVHARLG